MPVSGVYRLIEKLTGGFHIFKSTDVFNSLLAQEKDFPSKSYDLEILAECREEYLDSLNQFFIEKLCQKQTQDNVASPSRIIDVWSMPVDTSPKAIRKTSSRKRTAQ